jgi:hypothetical protein
LLLIVASLIVELDALSHMQLVQLCTNLNLPSDGSQWDLVRRIVQQRIGDITRSLTLLPSSSRQPMAQAITNHDGITEPITLN